MAAMVLGEEEAMMSIKEAMKQAMLQQEGLFRSQVRELHRLYWAQRNLMREGYRSPSVEEDRKMPAMTEVSQMRKMDVLEEWKSCAGELIMKKTRPLDLQLAADEEIPASFGDPAFVRSFQHATAGPWDKHLMNCWPRNISPAYRNFYGQGLVNSSSALSVDLPRQKQTSTASKPILIDLNIPHDDELNGNAPVVPSTSTSSSVVHHGSLWGESHGCSKEKSATCKSVDTYLSSSIYGGSNADCLSHGCQDMHHFRTQACARSGNIAENSCKYAYGSVTVRGPDLNVPAECCTTSATKFCYCLDGVENVSSDPSPTCVCKPEAQNVDLLSGQPRSAIHCDSRRQASTVTYSNANEYNNLNASVGTTSLPLTGTGDPDDKPPCSGGSEEDTVSSQAIAQNKNRQDELKIYTVVHNSTQTDGSSHCSSENQGAEKHEFLPHCKDVKATKLDPLATEIFHSSVSQDSSCSTEKLKPHGYTREQAPAAEVDYVISQAAETIVSISTATCACFPHHSASVECNERSNEPPYSDSFESMTLKLSDIGNDVCLMSTRSTEKEVRTDTCRSKLRRGRGLKDFQKDVLPGIVSLSRHEIREDLHAIGCEARKNGSRASHADNWFVPVRSRRSRLSTAGRRHLKIQHADPEKLVEHNRSILVSWELHEADLVDSVDM